MKGSRPPQAEMTKDKDLSKLNLIDRINMHYKNVPNVPFDDDELEWVEKANKTKTRY